MSARDQALENQRSHLVKAEQELLHAISTLEADMRTSSSIHAKWVGSGAVPGLQGAMWRHQEALHGLQATLRDVNLQIAKRDAEFVRSATIHAKWVDEASSSPILQTLPRPASSGSARPAAAPSVLVRSVKGPTALVSQVTPPVQLERWANGLEARPAYYYYGTPSKNEAKLVTKHTFVSATNASGRGLARGTVPIHRASASQRRLVF